MTRPPTPSTSRPAREILRFSICVLGGLVLLAVFIVGIHLAK